MRLAWKCAACRSDLARREPCIASTLQVRPGEVLALVGENGAGKSTLMKVLSGAHAPDEGEMWLDGQPYQPRNPLDARRHGIAMIYQELSLAPHLSVMENILLGIEPTRGPLIRWCEMRRRAAAALEQVGLANVRPETPVNRLSLAQQQMVEIARSVALESRVLVLDEPTSSLTRNDIDRLFALIRSLRSRGLSIIYISHFLEEVEQISDRFAVLRDGESVGTGVTATTPVERIIAMMVGREVEDLYPRSARRDDGEVVLEVRALRRCGKTAFGQLDAAPRQSAGHRRLDGRRPHRADAGDFRPRARGERRNPRGNVFRCLRAKAALGAGRRHGQRRSQTGGARTGAERRRQPDDVAPGRIGAVAVRASLAAAGRHVAVDQPAVDQVRGASAKS